MAFITDAVRYKAKGPFLCRCSRFSKRIRQEDAKTRQVQILSVRIFAIRTPQCMMKPEVSDRIGSYKKLETIHPPRQVL